MKLCEKKLEGFMICYIILTWIGEKRDTTVSHREDEFTNEFFFIIEVSMAEEVKALLKENSFAFQAQVVDDVFIVTYEKDTKKVFEEKELQLLKKSFQGMVKDIQQCRIMQNAELAVGNSPMDGLEVDYTREDNQTKRSKRDGPDQDHRFEDEPYWDEGEKIDETWKLGITGEGITVAILDIGFTVDHPELQPNINKNLTFNVVTYNGDVSAVLFHDYIGETIHKTNHGNDCASVVAAVKGNKMCSAGVAHNSKIAALSIGSFNGMPLKTIITTANICKGLAYHQSKIDIYSSSWTFTSSFEEMDIGSERAIIAGIEKGRQGRGNVYVSAVGPVGNGFTNNIFIIAVNQIGIYGNMSEKSYANPGVLISSFGKGKTRADDYMFTASQRYDSGILCNDKFQGSSAATPKIAGIVALILQSRPDLTWRQIQHLIVRCSSHTSLKESINFKRNGAGHYYHQHFGFGYLNVAKCIELSEDLKALHRICQA
ncbi:neuroendocrine convertase 2-like isoform X2 [Mya arenaria]|uniref:neuroendocrine convertase 2-like isoform X2 n=1 Tax=Mya arenaria TaxID=6604 RepID=UPI0022E8CD9B|nr:neuroendocrine convertase 2-like isoform X2 [Mya arenaria]